MREWSVSAAASMLPLIHQSIMGAGLGASGGAVRRMGRGMYPAGRTRRRRGTVCNGNFRVGAWAGDGSAPVRTRQLQRHVEREERKAARSPHARARLDAQRAIRQAVRAEP